MKSVHVPQETYKKLKVYCAIQELTIRNIVTKAVEDFLVKVGTENGHSKTIRPKLKG
jgi:hypothetical protein